MVFRLCPGLTGTQTNCYKRNEPNRSDVSDIPRLLMISCENLSAPHNSPTAIAFLQLTLVRAVDVYLWRQNTKPKHVSHSLHKI